MKKLNPTSKTKKPKDETPIAKSTVAKKEVITKPTKAKKEVITKPTKIEIVKPEILSIENLSLTIQGKPVLPVLQNVSFTLEEGEILALVGESGSGKSLTALSITKLLPVKQFEYTTGKIIFSGTNILEVSDEKLRAIRGKEIAYIFQDPFTSLNPLKKIKDQIIESYKIHISENEKEAVDKAKYLLNKVGLTELDDRLNSYPGQMSGGMLQRICIASALMCDPKLLIADEPTSALDVTIQSQLVDLLLKIKEEISMSILFISHDISLVASLANRIAVMYAGQIVEIGETDLLIEKPNHPYTQALLRSIPSGIKSHQRLAVIDGIVPSPVNYPVGCHFSTRCPQVMERCKLEKPLLYELTQNRRSACFLQEKKK
ncbi:MAG: ABC transporter ATP-binding protein [Leptospiraceae bacterium]|nr:ABC transporter ATP-binding protein [Leptospiraceae bacterium]